MSKFTEYLKLIPVGLKNPNKIVEGWFNDYNLENLSEDRIQEILRRRDICEECPLNSLKAKTSQEYKDLMGENYNTSRDDLHCSMCACTIRSKTASLSSNCGLETYNNNTNNINNIQELKWNKYEK